MVFSLVNGGKGFEPSLDHVRRIRLLVAVLVYFGKIQNLIQVLRGYLCAGGELLPKRVKKLEAHIGIDRSNRHGSELWFDVFVIADRFVSIGVGLPRTCVALDP